MRNKKVFVLLAVVLMGLMGCMENTDDVDSEWLEIREELVNRRWERVFQDISIEEDCEVRETWIFGNDGVGSCEVIRTYKDGQEESIRYFLWVLTLDLVINMDNSRYWELKELTPTKLYIRETWDDPIQEPGQMYREYFEYRLAEENV